MKPLLLLFHNPVSAAVPGPESLREHPLGPLQEPVPETAAGRWRGHPRPVLTHSLTIASQLMVGLL